jgi:hypothetical protein
MPKRTDISKILIIGSGPIIIGQSAKFDYSGPAIIGEWKGRQSVSLKWANVPVKIAIMLFCCIFLGGMAWSETVAVNAEPTFQSSGNHVQISIVLDGKPLKGARVDIYRSKFYGSVGSVCFSGTANENGIVTPSPLDGGDYRVVATFEDASTFLWLRVVDKLEPMTALFINLTQSARYGRQIEEEAVKRAEGLRIRDHVQVFQGTVVDASGAIIPEAKIRIMKNGPEGRTFVLGLYADSVGHFSAQLPDGLYLGIFYTDGFRPEAVRFEVTKQGSGNLQVTLQIGKPELPITWYLFEPEIQAIPLGSLFAKANQPTLMNLKTAQCPNALTSPKS